MANESSIPRCPHGVYSPGGDTSYCSVCSSPVLTKVDKEQAKKWEDTLQEAGLAPVTDREIISPKKEKKNGNTIERK